jgi:hypothetical protein
MCGLFFFLFWPLCGLFFFHIRILITPLVSSNSSYTGFRYNLVTNCPFLYQTVLKNIVAFDLEQTPQRRKEKEEQTTQRPKEKEEQTTQWPKEKEEQTTQWPKEKEEQTTQWPKEKEEQTTQWPKEKEEQSFTVATMTWLTVMEYLCHK